jgi:hypothetical protein
MDAGTSVTSGETSSACREEEGWWSLGESNP